MVLMSPSQARNCMQRCRPLVSRSQAGANTISPAGDPGTRTVEQRAVMEHGRAPLIWNPILNKGALLLSLGLPVCVKQAARVCQLVHCTIAKSKGCLMARRFCTLLCCVSQTKICCFSNTHPLL